jgi:hypothetical protein
VLADISGLGYYSSVPFEKGEELQPRGFILHETSESAPPTVLGQLEELVGLRFESIGILAEMNDKGMPFKHIAGYIAKHHEANRNIQRIRRGTSCVCTENDIRAYG